MSTPTELAEARAQDEARAHTRTTPGPNAQRAASLVDAIDDARWPVAVDIAEKALNEAEDRGARQPMPADADTIEALRMMVREMLEPALGSGAATERAANITQAITGNFHVRLMDEEDEPE